MKNACEDFRWMMLETKFTEPPGLEIGVRDLMRLREQQYTNMMRITAVVDDELCDQCNFPFAVNLYALRL